MKKILAIGGALAVAILVAPAFMAFEAHVVNVTATIENALTVPVESITVGTVFPQEHLNKPLAISLSGSFMLEDRVDDIEYFIRQKPKCGITSQNGTVLDHANTATGHVSLGPDDRVIIDCGSAPRTLVTGETWGVLPSLCEYISKEDDKTPDNDGSLASFHEPFTFANHQLVWNDAKGRLAKSENDIVDNWTIDLAVPCFGGYCAQDWVDFVHDINPTADPSQYTQPIANEHKVFGCDLWIEVSGVSCAQNPTAFSIVSDTSDQVQGAGNAVALSVIHPAWTATPLIPGATWIWATDPVAAPTTVDDTKVFTKQFSVANTVTSASIKIAADNLYILKVNGVVIGQELTDENNFQVGTYDTYIVNNLVVGLNTIEITGTNKGLAGSTPETNPAGIRYNLSYNTASSCVE